jgi:prepilin-type N-terminal cleavage/methylation domain-containing protein
MIELRSKLSAVSCQPLARGPSARRAFTLVEMLVAMAITLVMMAAVVTLFANVSNSVRNRRATIEMTGLLRHVRNTLQQDLQGATCPGVTWQRPDSNHGYIELIEGILSDLNPTILINDLDGDLQPDLSPSLSTIPRNNIGADGADGTTPDGKISARELESHYKNVGSFVPGGLGDHDDVLMFTVRNEHEPFVGRMPTVIRTNDTANPFDVEEQTPEWGYQSIESPLAEVVWFSVENPSESENTNANRFFGEPGMRTIYRRTLLIAPWLNPYSRLDNNGQEIPFDHDSGNFQAEPGLLRMLPDGIAVNQAIAAIIAFQDQYDLSARLEWDHNIRRWKIMANTLSDLTKRENRFGHYGFFPGNLQRVYPFPFISMGRGYSGTKEDVGFVSDPEVGGSGTAQYEATIDNTVVSSYSTNTPLGSGFLVRPFAFVKDPPGAGGMPATANAVLNEQGQVVRVTL